MRLFMMQLALVVLLAYSVSAEDVNSHFQSTSRKDLSKSAAGMHLSKRIETIKKMAEEKMRNFQATRFPNFVAGKPLAPPKIPSIPSYSPSTSTLPSLIQVTTALPVVSTPEITTTTAISTPVEETTTTTIKTTTVSELTTTVKSTTTEASVLEKAQSSRADTLEAKSAVSEKQIRMQEILKIKEQILKERDNRRNDREKLKQEQELSRQRILQNELLSQKVSEAPKSVAEQAKPVESACKQNPCLNSGICIDRDDGTYECKCSSDFKGLNCQEKVLNECSSNPCPENKVCKLIDGGYQCACPVGGCETKKNLCAVNDCLNSGTCILSQNNTMSCVCKKPWTGEKCEQVWENPCTEENLKRMDIVQFKDPWNVNNYIICSDISIYHSMPCSAGTSFDELYGHCVPHGYNAPVCPANHCKNEAECIVDEDRQFKCVCRKGFKGALCEINIDECVEGGGDAACGEGACVDQLNGFYCICESGIGLDCKNTIANPCTKEAIAKNRDFFDVPSPRGNTYLQCTSELKFVVSKCAGNLYWDQQEKACTMVKPIKQSGHCASFPCQNNGVCKDLGKEGFECVCKLGFNGTTCDTMIDSCESNPCQNGGRCLSFAGGYTCACPDKIIDDCCCNGILNPCPKKSAIIPGVNNYFPTSFVNRYIHCDFDGRAFVRKCNDDLKWSQSTLSCLPEAFTVQTPEEVLEEQELHKKRMQQEQEEIRAQMEQEKKNRINILRAKSNPRKFF